MKKNGKLPFSETSVIEFYDDRFVEITPENKTELKYSAVERASVVQEKGIYLHTNLIMVYYVPFTAFESEEQQDGFLHFIKNKVKNMEHYSS